MKRCRNGILPLFLALVCCAVSSNAACAEPLAVFGFESDLDGWTVQKGEAGESDAEAYEGSRSLKFVDPDSDQSVAFKSPAIALGDVQYLVVSGRMKVESGVGGYIRARLLNADKKNLAQAGGLSFSSARKDGQWGSFTFNGHVETPGAAYVVLEFSTYANAKVTAYLDAIRIEPRTAEEAQALPWEPLYRIKPGEKDRMTEADVLGPDGIVYPNWTKTGMQTDPDAPATAYKLTDFGGVAGDGLDDAVALERACDEVGRKGGGIVLLDEGLYYLDHPVYVTQSNVVIRGAGMDKTRVEVRYRPARGLSFFRLKEGQAIGPDTAIAVHADPTGILRIKIMLDDEVLLDWEKPKAHNGNRSFTTTTCAKVADKIVDGEHTLTAIAYFTDGSCPWESKITLPVRYEAACTDKNAAANSTNVIDFVGTGPSKEQLLLAEDGRRGSRELVLQQAAALAAGDVIRIRGPETDRWKQLTQNACQWGEYRVYIAIVEKCEGKKVTLTQPLRIEFPVIDGSFIAKMEPLSGGGVEGMTIEQTMSYWFNTIMFRNTINCRVRGVRVTMSGRSPVQISTSKWVTVSDCIFDDSWHKGSGGTAYVGLEHVYDCLMENVETFGMRHAPLFQWSASGCVIRNSVFHNSDAQWHSGWTNENLFENCTVTSVFGNGGYGYGMWASPPEDGAHGPNGPRNVVYNCDVSSPKDGIWIGGMNENWLVLHNRFVVEKGSGFFTKNTSFHHILRGNVFVLGDPNFAMSVFKHPDCVGAWIQDNRLYGGNGKIVEGAGVPEIVDGNEALPYDAAAPRPTPAVPSIYDWQQ